ncbi:hypothetical protein EI94DRAFT_435135 [Lactarius quietus]|nr:hypothetical protein EI94DRAFT_435135 [Lactarius quietus]
MIAASSFISFPAADVCLTPAGRGGDVRQAPVLLLDTQAAESRRGPARRVAGSFFFFSVFFFAALWSPALPLGSRLKIPKIIPKKKEKNTKPTSRKTIKAIKNIKLLRLDSHCVLSFSFIRSIVGFVFVCTASLVFCLFAFHIAVDFLQVYAERNLPIPLSARSKATVRTVYGAGTTGGGIIPWPRV